MQARASCKRGTESTRPLDKLLPPLNFKQKVQISDIPTITVMLNEMHVYVGYIVFLFTQLVLLLPLYSH